MKRHKRIGLLALMLCLPLLLSGCMSNLPEEKQATGERLPPLREGPEAPFGDSRASHRVSAVLYVPDAEATRLNAVPTEVMVESGQTVQEAVIVRLLELIDASEFHMGTQQLRLTPVSNPVETTGGLATVNLHTSMRSLSPPIKQFALRMAIVNTLTELSGMDYVNILVYGRDIGQDIWGELPTGVMERYSSNDIVAHWNQAQLTLTQTELSGEDEDDAIYSDAELRRAAALYFVSEDGTSLLGEVRDITFPARNASTYARELLIELARGPQRIQGVRTMVPEQDWFERDPVLVETEDGNYIELYFRRETESFLSLRDGTYDMMLSSICYTLTGFIPRLEGIIAYVDGELITELPQVDSGWAMQNGQLTRESVAAAAADTCTVYYPLANGAALQPVQRPIAQRMRTQPRALLRELMQTPEHPGLARALPEAITDADIIGLQIQDGTALVNVSAAFAQACQGMSEAEERNMIYAIVNTLTELSEVKRVRFFVEGSQTQLAGHLTIGGEFLRNTGLINQGSL